MIRDLEYENIEYLEEFSEEIQEEFLDSQKENLNPEFIEESFEVCIILIMIYIMPMSYINFCSKIID